MSTDRLRDAAMDTGIETEYDFGGTRGTHHVEPRGAITHAALSTGSRRTCLPSRTEGASVAKEVGMSRKLKQMQEEIERRGGFIHLSAEIPDAIAEQFLREVLDCPDCAAAAKPKAAGMQGRERGREH